MPALLQGLSRSSVLLCPGHFATPSIWRFESMSCTNGERWKPRLLNNFAHVLCAHRFCVCVRSQLLPQSQQHASRSDDVVSNQAVLKPSRANAGFEFTWVSSRNVDIGTRGYGARSLRWMSCPALTLSCHLPLLSIHPRPLLDAPSSFLGPPRQNVTRARFTIRQESHFLGLPNTGNIAPIRRNLHQFLMNSRLLRISTSIPPPADAADDNFLDFSGEDPGEDNPQVLHASPASNRVDSFPGSCSCIRR